ncbi:MAG: protein TolQ [Gammaproteobacteria bacterium]|jgi:biopolymer transport protein TolQ|nr:protein TolQ [Gammaproteobacteria bacterium]|tara:strand:+ start:945 stop:1613 length:669 start_codon:yes stop_codon:yes gene_type:complete
MSYSVIDLFLNASFIVQFVIILLLLASVSSWMIIFERWIYLSRSKDELIVFEDKFWSERGLEAISQEGLEDKNEPLGLECLFGAGYEEYKNLRKQDLEPDIIIEGAERAMRIALSREQSSLEKHLPFLATVSSASPYIGLFGTVWGIMNSFRGLAETNQATLSAVAPGISEALIATAIGLFAAIPALIAYNRFASSVENLISNFEDFIDEFSIVLRKEVYKK